MNRNRQKLPRAKKPLKPSEARSRLTHIEARRILESIDCSDVSGVQTRALASLMFYNHLRLAEALKLECGDVLLQSTHPHLLICRQRILRRRVDKFFVPCFPEAVRALVGYIEKAHLASDSQGPVFRTVDRKTGKLTSKPLSARAAHLSINQGARRAGIEREISPHEFRVAGARLLKEQLEGV